jgi:hypothetical protein
MHVRIESRRRRHGELGEKLFARAAAFDVVADHARFVHVPHDDVGTPRILEHLRRRCARLFVVVLSVDERREAVTRIRLDALPHVEHRATRRVDEHATDGAQRLERLDRHPKGREDHDVVGLDGREVEVPVRTRLHDLDAHAAELRVHVRVVDDLASEDEVPIGKFLSSLVGVLDGALDAIAEAELLREADSDVVNDERVVVLAQRVHDQSVVVGRKIVADVGFEAETLPEIGRGLVGWLGSHAQKSSEGPAFAAGYPGSSEQETLILT